MAQDFGAARRVQLVAAVAVAEEGGCAPLQVVEAELVPLGRMLQGHGHFGVFVVDEAFVGVAAVHTYQPVKQELERGRGPVPVHRPDDAPGIGLVEAAVEVQVPHQVGLAMAVFLIAVAGPHAQGHAGAHAGVAGLDFGAAVHVAQVFGVDVPGGGQAVSQAVEQGAGLAVHAGAVVLAAVGAGNEQHAQAAWREQSGRRGWA